MKKTAEPLSLDVFAFNEFVVRYHNETDRAAAVLAGGYLDSFLEGALRSVLVSGYRVDKLFDGQGPLRSLGSKISVAYGLGLATEALARDMDLVRKIRNHFAHHIWEATFEIPPVSDWCKQITVVDNAVDQATGERVKDSNPARVRYLLAVGMSTMLIAHSPKVPVRFREVTTGIREPT
jgi:mannitol repressor